MSIIPPYNLPIYLQKYSVDSTRYGTAVLFSTMSLIPSNVDRERVFQFTIAAVLQRPSPLGQPTQEIEFVIDYSNVDSHGYFITLEGDLFGTVTQSGMSTSLFPLSVYSLDTDNQLLYLNLRWNETWLLEDCPSKSYLFNVTINDASKSDCGYDSTWSYAKLDVDLTYTSEGWAYSKIGNVSSNYAEVGLTTSEIVTPSQTATVEFGRNGTLIKNPTIYFQYGAINNANTQLGAVSRKKVLLLKIYNDSGADITVGIYNSAGKIIPFGATTVNGCSATAGGPVVVPKTSKKEGSVYVNTNGMLSVEF